VLVMTHTSPFWLVTAASSSSLWNSMVLSSIQFRNSTRRSLANWVINAVSVMGLWALKMLLFYNINYVRYLTLKLTIKNVYGFPLRRSIMRCQSSPSGFRKNIFSTIIIRISSCSFGFGLESPICDLFACGYSGFVDFFKYILVK
jgi:hypothetical protein